MATIEMTHPARRSSAAEQPEPSLQVAGGIAALLEGLALIASSVFILGVAPAIGMKDSYWHEPSKAVPVIAAHQAFFVAAALFAALTALIVFPVVTALHDRLRPLSPGLITTATVLGVFGTATEALNQLVTNAEVHVIGTFSRAFAEQAMPGSQIAYDATLGGAGLGLGVWTLLLSWVVIRKGGLPRWLGYFGVLVGITDFLALIGPPIGEVVSIPWFIAVGIVLMRAPAAVARSESQIGI